MPPTPSAPRRVGPPFALAVVGLAVGLALVGCSTGNTTAAEDFSTSGSAAADQRAEQIVAKESQVEGAEQDDDNEDKTLYLRLGGARGLEVIVGDAVDRALADPRVNARRVGLEGGWFTAGVDPLKLSDGNIANLKKHLASFIALAAGGPADYAGPEVTVAFSGLQFTNIEFDAAVGDLQATLDKYGIADQEQKELLAIIETTREQVVEVR